MWSSHPRIILFRLQTESHRGFTVPIPLYILEELLDCLYDIVSVVCLFEPKLQAGEEHMARRPVHNARELLWLTQELLGSLWDSEPYELLSVTADKVAVTIKIR